jgi:hypothetical protein
VFDETGDVTTAPPIGLWPISGGLRDHPKANRLQFPAMTVAVRSFAKINLGLYFGIARGRIPRSAYGIRRDFARPIRSFVLRIVEYAFEWFAEHGGDSECGFQ